MEGHQLDLSNSYTMGCPPVRGDNPRALASGLSYAQADKLFYTTYISVGLARHKLVQTKVGKGGIKWCSMGKINRRQGFLLYDCLLSPLIG